jgi:hypothetical protein
MDLLGPLCEGIRNSSVSGAMRVPWHRWDQVLPKWLRGARDSDPVPQSDGEATSVAVVASSFSVAEAYLDLAASHSVTAVWCHSADSMRIRNIGAVWWDDSIAIAAIPKIWNQRVRRFDSDGRRVRHTWIANAVTRDQLESARSGGIDHVISKPFCITSLLRTLGEREEQGQCSRQAA